MHRCFIEPERWEAQQILPSSSETHHLRDVLRAVDGDTVMVFDGAGRQARAHVRIDAEDLLVLDVVETASVAERPFEVVLIQAIPKGARMDLIVEKATELGVARIIPVITDRGVVRLDAKQARKRAERWNRIALSASKQCGTPWIPRIDEAQRYKSALGLLPDFDAVLIGSLVEGVQPLHAVVDSLRSTSPESIAVIIGPEGDLAPAETAAAIEAGAVPVSFGGLTLRVETAALYAASVLAHEFLWRG
jgi:16S rRNA (uracil1498-N3)-methyltransferase